MIRPKLVQKLEFSHEQNAAEVASERSALCRFTD